MGERGVARVGGGSTGARRRGFCGVWAYVVGVMLLGLAYFGIGHESQFVFDKDVMAEVSRAALERHAREDGGVPDPAGVAKEVHRMLHAKYPKWVRDPEAEDLWMFNNAGGAMGSMTILHASLSEYVILFGTAVGTEGHTGRFLADDYFTILHGEQWAQSTATPFTREVYGPGDQHHLAFGVTKHYRMPDECWALEYARGNILSMMPFGLWDTLFSTVDAWTMYVTARETLKGFIGHMLMGKI